ncbi:MAG: SAM-dependent methyltransferase, partial [Psychroserpens sp.]|nr:SAM-dependent methyltransferase [Psychroserpens sp.]
MNLNESYWDDRYKNNNTGWDLGMVSPPLKSYFDQLEDKELRILIPGGGNSYEAEYLFSKGFPNIYVVDLSRTVLERFQERVPAFPSEHLLHNNFFDLDM